MARSVSGTQRPTRSKYPAVRTEGLIVEPLGAERELAVYDAERNVLHTLNSTARTVFEAADGSRTVAQIASLVEDQLGHPLPRGASREITNQTLRTLEKKHLLNATVALPALMSRRELVKHLRTAAGLTVAALPMIHSLVAPAPAAAASGCCSVTLGTAALDGTTCDPGPFTITVPSGCTYNYTFFGNGVCGGGGSAQSFVGSGGTLTINTGNSAIGSCS